MKNLEYKELAKANVQENRNIVISQTRQGSFTIAQQIEVKEGNRFMNVFLKNAIHVDEVQGLMNFRDALNVALQELQDAENKTIEEWDE